MSCLYLSAAACNYIVIKENAMPVCSVGVRSGEKRVADLKEMGWRQEVLRKVLCRTCRMADLPHLCLIMIVRLKDFGSLPMGFQS